MANRRERRAAAKAARAGAAAQRPARPSAPLAEAAQLYQSGRFEEAERLCRQVLAASGRDPYALYLLGMVAIATGRHELAESCLEEALALRPQEPVIHNGLALLRAAQGRFDQALAGHDRALALDAGDVGALIGRALALAELGNLPEAERSLGRARTIAPRAVEAARHHATVLAELGRLDEAALAFAEALALDPDLGDARAKLVELLCDLGRSAEAVERGCEGMRRAPESQDSHLAFTLALTRAMPAAHDPEIVGHIIRCFDTSDIDRDDLAKPAALQLRACYGLDAAPRRAGQEAVERLVREGAMPPSLSDELLRLLLVKTVNRDLVLEAFLTEIRCGFGLARELPPVASPLLAALALQCFNNDFVFALSDEEERQHALLKAAIEAELPGIPAPDRALEGRLLRYALYAPLASLEGAPLLADMAQRGWSEHFRPVLRRTLNEPLVERALALSLPSLGASDDETSRKVAAQYEEHPYPRWFALPRPTRMRLSAALRRRFSHATLPAFLEGKLEILIAGAGTGIQPITTALSLEDVEVLAVDLSRASLAYARRMASELGIGNLRFLQGDLLRLGELGRQFPVIEVVGVLHHLQSPLAGWRVLSGLLRPGGLMRVGLYSEAARGEIVAARARIAALGFAPVPADIRRFRQRVLFGSEAAEFPRLALSKDIYDLSGCRDLLFHACEHRFTLPQVQAMLTELGLDFVGFEHPSAAFPRHYRAAYPEDPGMTDLGNWARFEEAHPDAFPMYVFWCAKRS